MVTWRWNFIQVGSILTSFPAPCRSNKLFLTPHSRQGRLTFLNSPNFNNFIWNRNPQWILAVLVKLRKKKSDSGLRKVRFLRKYLRQNSKKPTLRLLSGGSKMISHISCDIDQLKLELQQIHNDGPPVEKSIKSMVKELKRKGKIDRGFFILSYLKTYVGKKSFRSSKESFTPLR